MGEFDDLIPKGGTAVADDPFSDLIPKPVPEGVKPRLDASQMLVGPDGLKRESGMESGTEFTAAVGEAMKRDPLGTLFTPLVPIPRVEGKTTLGKLAAAPLNVAGGLVQGAESLGGLLTLPLGGPVVKGIFSGLAAKGAGEQLGQASVTGDVQQAAEGILGAGLAPAIALHGSLPVRPPGFVGPLPTGEVLPIPRGSPAWRRPAFQIPDVVEEAKASVAPVESVAEVKPAEAAPVVAPKAPEAEVATAAAAEGADIAAPAKSDFAQKAIPALEQRIGDLHGLLINSEGFAGSEFYDKSFPIPREGGIIAARQTQKYQTDPVYAAKVDAAINDITDTMVRANRQRMALMDKPNSGAFGVDYSIGKARATYGVNVVRAWHNEAKNVYDTRLLGNISIREGFQNSLDAVLAAIQNGEIRRGTIKINTQSYDNKGFKIDDNGIGMSDADIGNKFLSLHSSGKAVQGRFGGFGIAKAVILGPADSGTWTLHTRDNKFSHELASANAQVETAPRRQGTEIEVITPEEILDDQAKKYVETSELPKNINVEYDGAPTKNPFRRLKSAKQTEQLNPETSYEMAYYPHAPAGYDGQFIIRLVDPKTGAKLTQAIRDAGTDGFHGTVMVDITTSTVPGTEGYPLVDSRMYMKWAAERPVKNLVEKHTIDPLSAKDAGKQSRFEYASNRSEWRDTLAKTQTDPGYKKLTDVINSIWTETGKFFGAAPDKPFTPLGDLSIKIDRGYKGYTGGTLFQAKHLASYEAVSRLMSHHSGANVTDFYAVLAKGGTVNAEHAPGGGMGLGFLNIDKTSLKSPYAYACYLRDLVAHELTHDFYGPHNEEFTSKLGEVQRQTGHLLPYVLRIAEAALGKEIPKEVVEKRVEVPVQVRIEVPVEKTTFVDRYLSPRQQQFIYDNVDESPHGKAKDDLYQPTGPAMAGQLELAPRGTGERPAGFGGAAEVPPVGGRTEQPGSPSPIGPEPTGVGTGEVVPPKIEPTPAAPAPKMEGMGGAVPGEFEGRNDYVSNMFAAIDRDRVAMGKQPMGETRPRTWDEDNQRALAQMNRDPQWIPDLLDSTEKHPRPLLSWENAGVVWQRAKWKAEYNNALQRVAQAFDDNRTQDLAAAKADAAAFEDKLERLDRIVGRNGTGSEAGRTLQAQKMGAGDDFTLIEMTLQKRAAVGGRRLTPDETARIQRDVEQLRALNKAMRQALADSEAKIAKAEADRAMAELKAQAVPTLDKRILAQAENIVVRMENAAKPHAAALREMLARMSAGVDPELIYHAAFVGSAKIARLGLNLAKFTDQMVTEFSEKIRPLIPEIWAKANEMIDSVKAPEPVKRAIRSKSTTEEVKTAVNDAIKEKIANGELSKIKWEINKLAKVFYKEGIRDREEMVDALHETIGPATGLTRRQVAEAFAGYGDFKQLSKDKMSVDLRGMKGELQQIAKLEAMQRGEPPLKSGLERRTPTDTERQLIKLVNDAKNKFQVPVQDPNTQLKSALDTLKTALTNRIKDYEDRILRKDYATRPRREVVMDTEATRLKAQAESIKKRWRQELEADRMKNRTLWEKTLDWGTKFRRFTALSSPVVIPKLFGAAGWRGAFTLPEDVAGRGLSLIPGISGISKRAPIEGAGGQLRATMRGYGAAFTQGLIDAANVAKTGHSDIDVLYGKAMESYTGELEMASLLLNIPGRMHGVIKAPVKRGGFEKARTRLEKWHSKTAQTLGEWYAKQGFPVTSEALKYRIAMDAYKYGNRQIFLQDSMIADGFNAALARFERKVKPGEPGVVGHPRPGGKLAATMARFMFPVTRVPTNIAAETLQYGTGSVTGSVRAINAIRKGLDTLTPDQADLIMRELKKGSVGMAALFLGYMGYQYVGGVYEQGKKLKPTDIKPDAARMFGVDIPGNLLHHPVLNTIQLGATIHKVAEEKLRRKDPDVQGLSAGLLAAGWGLADEVPFIQGPHRLFGGIADPRTRQRTLGNEVGSVVIPQAVAWLAQVLDQRRESPPQNIYQRITGPPARLNPQTITQTLETRIPGLRQQVPVRQPGSAGVPSFNKMLQEQSR